MERPDIIECPECYLVIKDGNQNPSYYFYNLSLWNGKNTISLENFWPDNGAISHDAIYGKTASVPEPAAVLFLGLSLLGLAGYSRKKFKKE